MNNKLNTVNPLNELIPNQNIVVSLPWIGWLMFLLGMMSCVFTLGCGVDTTHSGGLGVDTLLPDGSECVDNKQCASGDCVAYTRVNKMCYSESMLNCRHATTGSPLQDACRLIGYTLAVCPREKQRCTPTSDRHYVCCETTVLE